ncbi:MAG: glycoside hydrolase family 26 protein, partial [Actinomycetes bacterium]
KAEARGLDGAVVLRRTQAARIEALLVREASAARQTDGHGGNDRKFTHTDHGQSNANTEAVTLMAAGLRILQFTLVNDRGQAIAQCCTRRSQDRVYFGLHTPDAPFWFGEFEELGGMVGKSPSSVLFFQNFSQSFPTEALQSSWRRNALPIITWEPTIPNSAIGQPKLKDLTSGSWDRYLDAWARAAASFDKPIVIRFAHEMNGVWYTWSEGAWGNQPGDYVKAWRYIHDRFTAAGADNVIWMWNPNRVDYQRTPLETVYPGDEYVDWVGISGYYRRTNGASNFDATFSRTLEAIAAITTKPIFVGEAGADSGDLAGDVAWIADFFRGLAGHPGIVGFAWFNQAKSGNDWRLQRAPELLSAFSEGVRGDRFIGG